MIANARMYSLVQSANQPWRQLMEAVAMEADVPMTYVDHKPPAPISELWIRDDLGAVFMCGLPYSRTVPRPNIVAAPVPAAAGFDGMPQYWSELVVRADSGLRTIEDTFGKRIALTTLESQSGCLAALYYLMARAPGDGPLFQRVIEPRITPLGAMTAVIDGLADVAPIDSYAWALARHQTPELTAELRVIARTEPTPIPPIVSRGPVPKSLETAFLQAHNNTRLQRLLADLQLERFAKPEPEDYDVLKRRYDAAITFWQQHRFAAAVHPAFSELS